MGLVLPQEIKLDVVSNLKFLEGNGYDIPRRLCKNNKYKIPRGASITVSATDLPEYSTKDVECECDICHAHKMVQYKTYIENAKRNNGEYHCTNTALHKELLKKEKLNEVKEDIRKFVEINGRIPTAAELNSESNLPSYSRVRDVAEMNGTTLAEIMLSFDSLYTYRRSAELYDEYTSLYKKYMLSEGKLLGMFSSWEKAINDGVHIPTPYWMFKNAPCEHEIHNCSEWEKWAGLTDTHKHMTKERATELILQFASSLDRPLYYDDFRDSSYGKVYISTVIKYWGSLNKMKEALGLPIVQEDMRKRIVDIDTLDVIVRDTLNKIAENEGRHTITCKDFDCNSDVPASETIRKMVKKHYGIGMPEYIERFGFNLVKPGDGLTHTFDDGEYIYSRYELVFSNFLRSHGLSYGVDYVRDVKYRDICKDYDGLMNCDYVIYHGGRTIYIEIAGVLGPYKQWFVENKLIECSKSKRKYQIKLYEKKELLESVGVEYFFLFDCDMNSELLNLAVFGDYEEAKETLSKHYKHNISWSNVDLSVGITYDWSNLGRDGMPTVVYN